MCRATGASSAAAAASHPLSHTVFQSRSVLRANSVGSSINHSDNIFWKMASSLPAVAAWARASTGGGLPTLPHMAPKAKRCIYLHMLGAPPQIMILTIHPGPVARVEKVSEGPIS